MDKISRAKVPGSGDLDKDDKKLREITGDDVAKFNSVFAKKQKKSDEDGRSDKDNSSNEKDLNSKKEEKSSASAKDPILVKEDKKHVSIERDRDVNDDDSSFDHTDDPAARNNIPNTASVNPGDAILNNLNKCSEFYRATDGVHTQAAEVVHRIGNEVVERVLASNAALNAKQEVRIFLKNDVLAQTEVRITKESTTEVLHVEFHTRSNESAEFLSVNQPSLKQHLMNNLSSIHGVEIKIFHESVNRQSDIVVEVQNKTTDTKTKTRYKPAEDGQNDGRSKQEYVGDLDEDEEKNKE